MAKSSDADLEQIKELLSQVNSKIISAKVLNGGFDKLQEEVSQIKNLQTKLNVDFEAHKLNDERLESKIDKLYDPQDGIYAKVQKTEMMIVGLSEQISNLASMDRKFETRLETVETREDTTKTKLERIEKIAGEDNKDLEKSVSMAKNVRWFIGFAGVGLLSAIGKFLWDLLIG